MLLSCEPREQLQDTQERLRRANERATRERVGAEKLKKAHAAELARLEEERAQLQKRMQEEAERVRGEANEVVGTLRWQMREALQACQREHEEREEETAERHAEEVRKRGGGVLGGCPAKVAGTRDFTGVEMDGSEVKLMQPSDGPNTVCCRSASSRGRTRSAWARWRSSLQT